jgi:hypothetical protein
MFIEARPRDSTTLEKFFVLGFFSLLTRNSAAVITGEVFASYLGNRARLHPNVVGIITYLGGKCQEVFGGWQILIWEVSQPGCQIRQTGKVR